MDALRQKNILAKQENRISAAEVGRNFGEIQDRVQAGPLIVTHHGRPRIAMLSMEELEKLRGGGGESEAASRRKLTLILNKIAEGYVSLDRDWRVMTVNSVAEMFIGRSAEEMVGQQWREAFPTAINTALENHLRRAMEDGEAVSFESTSTLYPNRRVKVSAFPLPLPQGGIGILFTNATETYRMRDALGRSGAMIAALFENMLDRAIIMHDLSGKIAAWSAGAHKLLGWTEAEMIGRRLDEIFGESEREAGVLWAQIARVREEGRIEKTGGYRTAGGELVQMKGFATHLADGAEYVLYVLEPA